MKNPMLSVATTVCLLSCCGQVSAEVPIEVSEEIWANYGSGKFAPYYMASNRFGTVTQKGTIYSRTSAIHGLDTEGRWSFGFGADIIIDAASSVDYSRYDAKSSTWHGHREGPAWGWVQQLYGEVRHRSVFLTAGLKEVGSALLNNRLSSGDLTWSANSRPMPGVRIGFIDFVDIPFTGGWLQINGNFFFGKPTDNDWLENHYNFYNAFITTGRWINYKRCYFRTNPQKPLSVTVGMQAAAQFAGHQRYYYDGNLLFEETSRLKVKDFFNMMFPHGGDNFYDGNHLGSWDMMADYRLAGGERIKAYFQWPWEDGSGIGKLNGFDGLWGLEYDSGKNGLIRGAVIEYLDFSNQSGPLHWAPGDNPGTTIPGQATGADTYYNNYYYNGYAYYGMSQGTPMLKSPIYNTDGYLRYTDTRIKGFHAAVTGTINSQIEYRAMISYRKSSGDTFIPALQKVHSTSFMVEATYLVPSDDRWAVKAQMAMDRGNLYGNSFGVGVSVTYKGLFILKK
ncbi:MAG: capsule assembly Wzi family protein [Muribaculum sp.]|nr:capsule assembly Wzi family protein [Muribaculum sp.]